MIKIIIAIAWIFGMMMPLGSDAFAQISKTVGVRCLMGEARGESYPCMVATAEVIRLRDSESGIYGCTATINEPDWVWAKARKAWAESKHTDLSNGATHFESTDFKTPYWAEGMVLVAHVGKHKFYK